MSTSPSFQTSLQFEHRARKRAEVEDFFSAHLGQKFSSYWLHVKFGQGVRARISEIHLDTTCPIDIKNQSHYDHNLGQEVGEYWAELRPIHRDLG